MLNLKKKTQTHTLQGHWREREKERANQKRASCISLKNFIYKVKGLWVCECVPVEPIVARIHFMQTHGSRGAFNITNNSSCIKQAKKNS